MSYSRFTNGDWKATQYGYEKYSVNCNNTVEIASCWNKHNAHLIAAAPEMYGMLERILKPYGREDISDDAIENLLAKARGEHEQTN